MDYNQKILFKKGTKFQIKTTPLQLQKGGYFIFTPAISNQVTCT